MTRTFAALAITLTISTASAWASPIATIPCASHESVQRAFAALEPYMHATPQPAGFALMDCHVQASRRLDCVASHETESAADVGAAAVAFTNELEACPGTPRHFKFPLVIRADESATPSPSP